MRVLSDQKQVPDERAQERQAMLVKGQALARNLHLEAAEYELANNVSRFGHLRDQGDELTRSRRVLEPWTEDEPTATQEMI